MNTLSHGIQHLEQATWAIADLTGLSCTLFSRSGAVLATSQRSDRLLAAYRKNVAGHQRYRNFFSLYRNRALTLKEPVVSKGPTGQRHMFIPVLQEGARFLAVAEGFYTAAEEFRHFFDLQQDEAWAAEYSRREWQEDLVIIPEKRISGMLKGAERILTQLGEKDVLQACIRCTRAMLDHSAVIPQDSDMTESVSSIADTESVAFLSRQNGSYRVTAATGKHSSTVDGLKIPATHQLLAPGPATAAPRYIGNAALLQEAGFPEEIYAAEFYPLNSTEGCIGFLAVLNEQLSPSHRQLVDQFCQRLATLYRLHEKYEKTSRRIEAIGLTELKIARLFFKHRDWRSLCKAIVSEAASLVDAENCSLMLPDTSHLLRVNSTVGRESPAYAVARIRPGEGIAGGVYESGEPLVLRVPEQRKDSAAVSPAFKTSSCLSMPLRIGDRTVGILNLSDKVTGAAFSLDDLTILAPFALQASMLLELGRYNLMTHHLGELSITDPLTGIFNRRYFDIRLKEEYERARRHATNLSLAIADLDNFKTINDTFGHAVGDHLLKEVAIVISTIIRTHDVAARLGGDEFAIIMPYMSHQDAGHAAERIREAVNTCITSTCGTLPDKAVTVCIGYATYPECGDTTESMTIRADQALYIGKNRGKDAITGL